MRYLLLICLLLPFSVQAQNEAFIGNILESIPLFRDSISQQLDEFELQVIYRPLIGVDSGFTYRFNVDPDRYFYPASTVKLPTAALMLQWINEQGIKNLTRDAVVLYFPTRPEHIPQEEIENELSLKGRLPLISNFVADAMVVSDNMAYNRIYEFLGQFYINTALHHRDFNTRIVHRVGVKGFNEEANRWLPHVLVAEFLRSDGEDLYSRYSAYSKTPYNVKTSGELKGVGRFDDSLAVVVNEPFDFSTKNFLALEDLSDILQAIVLPESIDSMQRFNMSEEDRLFLVETLSTRPADSSNPKHLDKPDGYVNFLYYGGEGSYEKDGPKIYNKVGIAYGCLTEAAVFAKADGTPQFLLSATINVNQNGIYNDGIYAYDSIGLPFLEALGRAFWELER